MKVAVTYGEDEMVFQHFGHTERFKIYTVEDGKVISGEVVETAFYETAPHRICQYMAEVSDAFNDFYQENKILAEEDEGRQAALISLITLTRRVLDTCMDLLGMESPEHM